MTADRLPAGAAILIDRVQASELDDADKAAPRTALRALGEGRPVIGILNGLARERRDAAPRAMRGR